MCSEVPPYSQTNVNVSSAPCSLHAHIKITITTDNPALMQLPYSRRHPSIQSQSSAFPVSCAKTW
jgi:hypothetical protein